MTADRSIAESTVNSTDTKREPWRSLGEVADALVTAAIRRAEERKAPK